MAKKKIQAKKSFKARDVGVVLEAMDKKFDLVLEGHGALDSKIDEFRHETRAELGFIKFANNVASNKINDLAVKSDQNFKVIREYLSHIDVEVQDLAKRLERKADLERLEQLQGEVAEIKLVVKKFYGKTK